jgi:hypothetical protein
MVYQVFELVSRRVYEYPDSTRYTDHKFDRQYVVAKVANGSYAFPTDARIVERFGEDDAEEAMNAANRHSKAEGLEVPYPAFENNQVA